MHHRGLHGNALKHQATAHTHLWQELYYKLPPSAAVPMRMERAKAKSDGQVIRSLNRDSEALIEAKHFRLFLLYLFKCLYFKTEPIQKQTVRTVLQMLGRRI